MNLNRVFIIGRLAKEPETSTTNSGTVVVKIDVATSRTYYDKETPPQKKEEVEFHQVVTFGKLADVAAKYCHKGDLVLIEGRLKTNSWTDKTTGQKRYKVEIIASAIQFGPKRQTTQNDVGQVEVQKESVAEVPPEQEVEDDDKAFLENLPF